MLTARGETWIALGLHPKGSENRKSEFSTAQQEKGFRLMMMTYFTLVYFHRPRGSTSKIETSENENEKPSPVFSGHSHSNSNPHFHPSPSTSSPSPHNSNFNRSHQLPPQHSLPSTSHDTLSHNQRSSPYQPYPSFNNSVPVSSERRTPQSHLAQPEHPQASTSTTPAPEFVDSSEKVTDPGLPALSNPLKLLGLFLSAGAYVPRPEEGARLDPIKSGLVSSQRASHLVSYFLSELNVSLCLLDPVVYSFNSILKHPTLLAVICLIVSRMEHDEEAAQISERLQTHFENILYPAVVLEGYRTTEIAIAFLLYAAYHPATKSLREDRTWTYAGHSLRMAIELDLNSKIHSGGLNRNDESMQRLFRNRER